MSTQLIGVKISKYTGKCFCFTYSVHIKTVFNILRSVDIMTFYLSGYHNIKCNLNRLGSVSS